MEYNVTDQVTSPSTEQPVDNQQQIDLDALANKIAKITKGDTDKPKYDSVEKAVDSIPHREQFIETLKAENAAKDQRLEELEKRLVGLETKTNIEDRIVEKLADQQDQVERPSNVGVDEQKLGEMVAALVAQQDTDKVRTSNAAKFLEAVSAETDNPEKFIEDAAANIGVGVNTFQDLIGQSPDAALKLAGVGVRKTTQTTQPNLNTSAFTEKQDTVQTKRIFEMSSQKEKMGLWDALKKQAEAKLT